MNESELVGILLAWTLIGFGVYVWRVLWPELVRAGHRVTISQVTRDLIVLRRGYAGVQDVQRVANRLLRIATTQATHSNAITFATIFLSDYPSEEERAAREKEWEDFQGEIEGIEDQHARRELRRISTSLLREFVSLAVFASPFAVVLGFFSVLALLLIGVFQVGRNWAEEWLMSAFGRMIDAEEDLQPPLLRT